MRDWNIVATVRGQGFDAVRRFLAELGPVHRCGLYNVLVMKVDDIRAFLESLRERFERKPEALSYLSTVAPVTRVFEFETLAEFAGRAREAALAFIPELAGKSFHVRFHRRGFKGQLATVDEERFLDGTLLEALQTAGTPSRITFDDPDAVLCVEAVDSRAGPSLWAREDLQRFPFLRPD